MLGSTDASIDLSSMHYSIQNKNLDLNIWIII